MNLTHETKDYSYKKVQVLPQEVFLNKWDVIITVINSVSINVSILLTLRIIT